MNARCTEIIIETDGVKVTRLADYNVEFKDGLVCNIVGVGKLEGLPLIAVHCL